MDTIYSLLKRAKGLKEKSQVDSITPEEVSKLHEDTLAYIASLEQSADGLGIKKVYQSKSAMEADTDPVGTNGKTLRYGQLVSIYDDAHADSSENGNIYAYQKPGWLLMGKVSGGSTLSIVQEAGDSEASVMSQKAVTSLIPTYDASKSGNTYESLSECLTSLNQSLSSEQKKVVKQITFTKNNSESVTCFRKSSEWSVDPNFWIELNENKQVDREAFEFDRDLGFTNGVNAVGKKTQIVRYDGVSVSKPFRAFKGDKISFFVVSSATRAGLVKSVGDDDYEVLVDFGRVYGEQKVSYVFSEDVTVRIATPTNRISEIEYKTDLESYVKDHNSDIENQIEIVDNKIASYFAIESASRDKDYVNRPVLANTWYSFTHSCQEVYGLYVQAREKGQLQVGKVDISKKPYTVTDLHITFNLKTGRNTLMFDTPVNLSDTEYVAIKSDNPVLYSADGKPGYGVIIEGAESVGDPRYSSCQFSLIYNKTKNYREIVDLFDDRVSACVDSLKLRPVNSNLLTRVERVSFKSPLLYIPVRTRTFPIDSSRYTNYVSLFNINISLFDENKEKIVSFSKGNNVDFGKEVDVSMYPHARYYQFVINLGSQINYPFYIDGSVELSMTDIEYLRYSSAPTSTILTKDDRRRIAFAVRKNIDGDGVDRRDLGILHISDSHSVTHQLVLASQIAKESSDIQAIINTGDLVGSTFGNSSVDALENVFKAMNMCGKPTFLVIGNHDRGNTTSVMQGASLKDVHDYFIKPIHDAGHLTDQEYVEGECYYYHDFKEKGIRLITLNQYDNDDLEENEYWEAIDYDPSLGKMSFNTSYTYDESNPLKLNCGNYTKHSFKLKKSVSISRTGVYRSVTGEPTFKIHTGSIVYSEKQLNWFCKTLLSTPVNYKVVVAIHAPVGDNMVVQDAKFSELIGQGQTGADVNQSCLEKDIIQDILKAFNEKQNFSENVKFKDVSGNNGKAAYLNTKTDSSGGKYAYTIACDFSKASNAQFLCFIGGHIHWDTIYKDENYGFNSIHCIGACNTAGGGSQGGTPVAATWNEDSEYAFNVIGFGKPNTPTMKEIRMVRVGNALTNTGKIFDFVKIDG